MMNNASGQTGSSANNGIRITFIGLHCHQMYKEPSTDWTVVGKRDSKKEPYL